MSEICVVHLVWAPLGIETFGRFLSSYKQHGGGIEHGMVIVFNGFREEAELSEYYALLDGLDYESFFMPTPTQDIPAYFAAVGNFKYKYFCFLNSHSVLLDENWLAKVYEHIRREGVGVVGFTGSHESPYSSFFRYWRWNRTRWIYRGMFGIEYRKLRELLMLKHRFPPFPNYHIRSNGFCISRKLMLSLKVGAIKKKMDAYEFESGRESMTRQVLGMNLKALVVGRDGRAYEKEKWYESFTFRSGDQQNLLVADNQTRHYETADAKERRRLIEDTWGKSDAPPSAL